MVTFRRGWSWPGPAFALLMLAMCSSRSLDPAIVNPGKAGTEPRTEPADADPAMRFQEIRNGQAQIGIASSGLLGGDSLEGVYFITLPEFLRAARRSLRELQVAFTHQESYSMWAAVDGRRGDSTPVRIKGENLGEMRTRVLLTVCTSSRD